ncbi:hypothetical protein EON83_04725 [bacterium]|nr:MAG: hypothetical protein EON83_04725 [bacterium]
MENQNLIRAIESYDPLKSDYELYWQLAFAPPVDVEELADRCWRLTNEPPYLPIPFVALVCRLCLETSNSQCSLNTAYKFLRAHGDDNEMNLEAIVERLNLQFEP